MVQVLRNEVQGSGRGTLVPRGVIIHDGDEHGSWVRGDMRRHGCAARRGQGGARGRQYPAESPPRRHIIEQEF